MDCDSKVHQSAQRRPTFNYAHPKLAAGDTENDTELKLQNTLRKPNDTLSLVGSKSQ
jgi:hypothetical protein